MGTRLEIRLLGPLEVSHEGRTAALGGPRQRSVLAMLALARPDVVSTDRLVDGVWGEAPPAKPLSTLQVFVHNLRKAVAGLASPGAADAIDGRDVIVSRAPGYLLGPPPLVTTDLERFAEQRRAAGEHVRAGDHQRGADELQRALALWRGPALADLRDAPFAESELARLDELRLLAEEDAFDLDLLLGRHAAVVPALEERVRVHPTRERLWGQLMVALYRSDRQADALTAYGRARDRLADELGIDPGEALRALELGILRQDPELSAPRTPAPHASSSAPDVEEPAALAPRPAARLPRPLTPTIGRTADVDQLRALLRDGTRLVTLTGVGGAGKTRLAVEAADGLGEEFPAGTWFCSLVDVDDGERLGGLVARTLTGTEPAADGVGPLVDEALAGRRGLLVLDNLEDVGGAGLTVGALLAAAPDLTVLATSRLPLSVTGEHEFAVTPLATPLPGATEADVVAAPAVQLFTARARAASRTFSLDAPQSSAEDVAELCRLLDGVPLAIELAAARVKLMPPARIAASLRDGLEVLTSSAADVPARQRALTSTVAWSLAHLDEAARALCDRLVVFEEGFTLDALEAVCGAGQEGRAVDVLTPLAALVDASLVRSGTTRIEVRFDLLGTVRTYLRRHHGGEDGPEPGTVVESSRRLATWLLGRALAWTEELDTDDGQLALARFEDEHANMQSVLEVARVAGDVDVAADLTVALHDFWVASGRLVLGLRHVEAALALPGLDGAQAARLHAVGAKLAYHRTDWDAARSAAEQAFAGEPDELSAAMARCYLAGALVVTGEPVRGAELAARAGADAVRLGHYPLQVVSLSVLAIAAAVQGEFDAERGHYEERLRIVRAHGDRARVADTLNTLAEIALDEQDPQGARAWAGESLSLAGERLPLEHRDALISLARADVAEGETAQAVARVRSALALSERTGQALATAQCWRVVASLAAEREPAHAVRVFAAAQVLHPSPSGTDEPVEQDFAAALGRARDALGREQAARTWTLGSAMPASAVSALVDEICASVPVVSPA